MLISSWVPVRTELRDVPFAFIEALCGRLNAKANFGLKWKVLIEGGREGGCGLAAAGARRKRISATARIVKSTLMAQFSRLKKGSKCQIRNDPSTRVICSFNSEIVMLLARWFSSLRKGIIHQVKQITYKDV